MVFQEPATMAFTVRTKARPTIHEFDLIRALHRRHGRRTVSVIQGIGDDAAIITSRAGQWTVLTTDLFTEGVHFDLRTATMDDIGFRAAAANLSDIAAMGGTPQHLLVALAIPRTALFRSGARIGDFLYVTGTIGDALAGLRLLNEPLPRAKRHSRTAPLSTRHRQFLIGRHMRPTARIAEGQWLSTHRFATSAIDISDGLSGDLRHICGESHVGADLDLGALPLSPACHAYAASRELDPVDLALTGGEDYELLFTVSPRERPRLEQTALKRGFPLTCIGQIHPLRFGIQAVSSRGRRHWLANTSYEHFT